ncbi:MAG: hypothetical protein LUD78_11160, partial [Clostridiales bacterium]|nr:hypothetical protein [Clostridiales bacterium]
SYHAQTEKVQRAGTDTTGSDRIEFCKRQNKNEQNLSVQAVLHFAGPPYKLCRKNGQLCRITVKIAENRNFTCNLTENDVL